MVRAALVIPLLAAPIAGCYAPHYPVGLACAPMTRACPPGQGCNIDGTCAPNPDGAPDVAGAGDGSNADRDAAAADAGPRCGDGTRDPGEECDHAADAGGGCDPTCHVEGLIGHWALGDEYADNGAVPDLAIADGAQNGIIVNHTGDLPVFQPVPDRHGTANEAIAIRYDSPKDLADRYGYIHFPDITSPPPSVTMTVWIAQSSTDSGDGFLFGIRRGPHLYQKSGGVTAQVPSSASDVAAVGNFALTKDRWTFVAGVFTAPATTGGTWGVSLYVDGALVASGTPANANIAAVGDLLLGGLFNCSDFTCEQGFVGSLDDARFYDRALSAAEIDGLFQLP